MKLINEDAKNFEYALDIFKGTCMLNDYSPTIGGNNLEQVIDSLKLEGKYFYYTVGEEIEFGSVLVKQANVFERCELINLAIKILFNLGIEQATVKVDDEDIMDNLQSIDIPVEIDHSLTNAFKIVSNKKVLIEGNFESNRAYFTIEYERIKDLFQTNINDELDLYIQPLESNVFSDAFVIATNLKDSGFKIKVDYSLKKLDYSKINSAFLIKFDAKDIKKYIVHYVDLKTLEEKEVMIDNLIEELSFF